MIMAQSWRTYAQLVRLPNVFTALADIGLGLLAISALEPEPVPWLVCVLLMAASACLYSSGMVWNDFFDIEQDRRERPFRPLPSGRVSRRQAALIGSALMLLGILLAALADTRSFIVGLALVCAILLYDCWLKKTWAGPIGMGLCRFLNVLLGLSVADATLVPWSARIYLAAVVGIYIVGVTWFARTEARASSRQALTLAACTMLVGLFLALPAPVLIDHARPAVIFPYLLVILGFLLGVPIVQAINRPIPGLVQPAVKRSIMGLVILDATLATGLVGSPGLFLLVLLLPTLYLGRWIYST
jgi:4-hydroxybenzoate polyprenyltransferase